MATVSSPAQTIYVDQRSCIEEDGSADRPFRTLTPAVDAASAGSTLVVQAGSYPETGELPLTIQKNLAITASAGLVQVGELPYAERLAQLTGDYDPEDKAHINYTGAWGVPGVDLGATTEHCDNDGT